MASLPASASPSSLPSVPLTNPCRNWMEGWAKACDKLCCHTHPSHCPCADISCDGCGYSIVRPGGATTIGMNGHVPGDRYVCLDCEVNVEYESEHWSTHFCEPCFASMSRSPHFGPDGAVTRNWLRISSIGEHTAVTRGTEGDVEVAELTVGDLTTYDAGAGAGGMCPACFCDDITAENPVATLPGCTEHKCCASGCLERVKAKNSNLFYVRSPDGRLPRAAFWCSECARDERMALEVAAVLVELKVLLGEGRSVGEAVALLKDAHALKPGSSVNVHLHAALDKKVSELTAAAAARSEGGEGGGGS